MSDTVLVALISAVGSCIAAGLGAWALKTTRDVKVAVTKNGGTSNPPTLPDRLHEIDVKQHELGTQQALTHQLVEQLAADSAEERARRHQAERDLWAAINDIRRRP